MNKEDQEPEFILWNETESKVETNNQEDMDQFYSMYEDQSFKFNDFSTKVEHNLGKYNENVKYLVVYPGVNIKGTCKNKNCKGYLKNVWVKKGYGIMNVGQIKTGNICPCCQQKMSSITFTNLGYRQARVVFEGVKIINEEDVSFKYQDTENNGKFITFKDVDENICEWSYLNLDVQPI